MSKKQKQNIALILMFISMIGGSAFFAIKALGNVTQPKQRLEDTATVSKIREEKQQLDEGEIEPMNILLLGLDGEVEGDGVQEQATRTDAIVILSINPNTKTTKMLSIPRDTRVYYPQYNNYDKINHAYVYGGPQLTMQLVEELLHIPIDYYASVNMKGLQTLVDAIGGVEVTSPLTFNYKGTGFVEGETRPVNGVKAMNFIRMRKEDPQGDFGRQERQKILIKAIADKLMDMSLVQYTKLIPFLLDNVRTDVDILSAYDLYTGYKSSVSNLEIIDARGAYTSVTVDGIYYMLMDDDLRYRIANELRLNSGISELSTLGYIDYYADDLELHNSELQEVDEDDYHLYEHQHNLTPIIPEPTESDDTESSGDDLDLIESDDTILEPTPEPESSGSDPVESIPESTPDTTPEPTPEPTPEIPEPVTEGGV